MFSYPLEECSFLQFLLNRRPPKTRMRSRRRTPARDTLMITVFIPVHTHTHTHTAMTTASLKGKYDI